ncbi:MAG TPA: PQQ-binding-like beta-propeller repeat protein, partial [Capsulimonadaceae bacterium]|nr:PQQ-binding-like beta-propeller repeat protein [Capsulimonadaceae bacterium]
MADHAQPTLFSLPRLLSICLALIALLFAGPEASHAQANPPAPGFNLAWNRPVPSLTALAISPQGERLAMITTTGKLAAWSAANGTPLWSQDKKSAQNIAISDGIGYVLAYDALDPLNTSATLLSASNGNSVWSEKLDGAVWAVAVSRDGLHAAISTGKRALYFCTLDPEPHVDKWQLDGICDSLAFAPNDDFLAAGLWSTGGVECFGMNGKQVWRFSGRDDRRYDVSITPDSEYVVALGYANHKASDGVITLLAADDGGQQFSYALGSDSYYSSVLVGDGARTTFVSFSRVEMRGNSAQEPRRLVALDHSGHRLWDKGGLFFSPTLV